MGLFSSENLVGRGLPVWYFFLSFIAIVEVGVAGYLVGKGSLYSGQLRSTVRFALFTALWTLLFGTLVGVGTLVRRTFFNTGAAHFVYLFLTIIFWIAVGASLQKSIYNNVPNMTTLRACEWLGWVEAILTVVAVPWVLLGVAHAKGGIRGNVAV